MNPELPPCAHGSLATAAITHVSRLLLPLAAAFLVACAPEDRPATESDAPPAASAPQQDDFPARAAIPPDTPVSSDDTGAVSLPSPRPVDPASGTPDVPAAPPSAPGGGSTGSTGSEQGQGLSLDAVIDRASRAYAAARTARGSFTQTLVNRQLGSTANSAGTFLRQQPDKFAFEFSDPSGDRIVADGRYVWLYLPSTNPDQVLRSTLSPSSAGSYDIGSLFFDRTRERFEVVDGGRETLGGRPARVLRLTPRSEAPFSSGTVWVEESSGSLLQFTVTDQMGLERTVRITSQEVNVPVPASAFVFEVPAGVRVVDTESIGR